MRPKPSRPREVERVVLQLGFIPVHTSRSGSNRRYKHPDGRSTTIAFHSRCDIPIGTLRAIINDLGISVEQYNALV